MNNYIQNICKKFQINEIKKYFEDMAKLNVLVIGDIIIDDYVFVRPKGRAIKDPILSVEYRNRERYAGGILAVANHLSSFVNNIKILSIIGEEHSEEEFIMQSLSKNIEFKSFTKPGSPTTVKKRFIDKKRDNKLFKIEYMNDNPIDEELTNSILLFLDEELPKYDLVVVGDFGHGFINDQIRRKIEAKAKYMALNVQSNSANMGYNYFNLYKKFNYLTMDEQELRLPFSHRFENVEEIAIKAFDSYKMKFLVTRGPGGCMFINKEGKIFNAPILISNVKDTVGAGDAVFAISTLFSYFNANDELMPFIANCAGGISANFMGNKESVSKEKLLKFLEEIYKNGME